MKKVYQNQLNYLFLALIMIPMGSYSSYSSLASGEFPQGMTIVFLGVSALMMSYLSPHLFPRDERAEKLIGKAMTYNFYAIALVIILLLMLDLLLENVEVTKMQFIAVLISVMSITPTTVMVFCVKEANR
ncbi:hypothetical protein [Kurthia sibirica]|uniref:Permease n=1 Tax=Kurthia sibirica TaxID=202750 RepID=A0A2U3AL56_9BACL|nr:hypothetical protein [Kurthia sibirica]PWI25276.1 hypothetical protein DEX24_09140 [Kurthia sibirica]GEK35636.1 hypothetical protein KSI01_31690 [Kurthia sibirica]